MNAAPYSAAASVFLACAAAAAPNYVAPAGARNYIAERDPALPEPGKQYRLWLRTPGKTCSQWRKVKPLVPKEDMLLSEGKRDETGKEPGCKFTFVIQPATPPGAMKFELEPSVGAKEHFEVPAGTYASPPSVPAASGLSGIANENGSGMAPTGAKSRLNMGSGLELPKTPSKDQKHLDPGTGL